MGVWNVDDLVDFVLFAVIVEKGGIAAASRNLKLPKSRLSRRLAALEERHSVQLIHRSSRRFAVTEFGQSFYEHCKEMVESSQAAQAFIAEAQTKPTGLVRLSAPTALSNFWLTPLLPKFLEMYPDVQLELYTCDRYIDLVADRIDVAIRVRPRPLDDSDTLIRNLGASRNILVAAPSLLSRHDSVTSPERLSQLPLLASLSTESRPIWRLQCEDGRSHKLTFSPRFASYELGVLRACAVAGVGVALLPAHFCRDNLNAGTLIRVLPNWGGPIHDIHIAYLSRRGLSASARALLDFLAFELRQCDRLEHDDLAGHPPPEFSS